MWVVQLFKTEIQNGRPNNSGILKNWFPQEIRSPLLNLGKSSKYKKNTAQACRGQSNQMNDKEFGSFNFLKLKHRRGDQIIQPFCRIGCPLEIRSPLLNLSKSSKHEKSTAEPCRIQSNLMNDKEFRFRA